MPVFIAESPGIEKGAVCGIQKGELHTGEMARNT